MKNRRNWSILIAVGIGFALLITLFSPFASSSTQMALNGSPRTKSFSIPRRIRGIEIIPDYTFPGVENQRLATIRPGIVGVLIVAAIGLGIGYGMKMLARSRANTTSRLPSNQRAGRGRHQCPFSRSASVTTMEPGSFYRADPCVKILIAVLFAFAVTTVSEGHWLAYAGFGHRRAPGNRPQPTTAAHGVSRCASIALPFVAAAIPLIFTRPGDTVLTVPLLGWTASAEGLTAVASIMIKSWMAVLLAVVLTSCTPTHRPDSRPRTTARSSRPRCDDLLHVPLPVTSSAEKASE